MAVDKLWLVRHGRVIQQGAVPLTPEGRQFAQSLGDNSQFFEGVDAIFYFQVNVGSRCEDTVAPLAAATGIALKSFDTPGTLTSKAPHARNIVVCYGASFLVDLIKYYGIVGIPPDMAASSSPFRDDTYRNIIWCERKGFGDRLCGRLYRWSPP